MARYKTPAKDLKRFKGALEKALAHTDEQGITALEHVARALVRNAMLGKEASISMIADRIDGKVVADILETPDGVFHGNGFEIIAIKGVPVPVLELEAENDDEEHTNADVKVKKPA